MPALQSEHTGRTTYYYYYYYYYDFVTIIQDKLHALAPPIKNWRILFQQSFTACYPCN